MHGSFAKTTLTFAEGETAALCLLLMYVSVDYQFWQDTIILALKNFSTSTLF